MWWSLKHIMRTRILVFLVVIVVVVTGIFGYAIGLYGYERHSGFFAPVWDEADKTVIALRRTTSGFVWGFGWEFFSPPASSYVTSDTFELLRIDPGQRKQEVLARWHGSPLLGRVTRHYRGRIFNYISAQLAPSEKDVRVRVRMSIPRVPSSEVWGIDTMWKPEQAFQANWVEGFPGGLARPEATLTAGREVLTVPGKEGFDVAVLVVDADGSHSILIKSDDFDALYPDGIPSKLLAERSNRKQIEKVRDFRKVKAELVERFMSEEGLREGDAILRAYDEMEKLGYLPRKPRITATLVQELPADTSVFDIPRLYLEAGLFQDIAKAIVSPGTAVKTGLGTYLKYNEDDLGPRLRAFREAGGNRFGVRIDDRLFLIEQGRP
jgi:hypothetical protein